jgi:iron(III) transport system ATP-binding protein
MNNSKTGLLLELAGVSKRFGKTEVLREIDLGIADGEFICFLGPSGCGKSTLLRIIAGLEEQTGGRLVKNGNDISRLPASQRDVGILFQSYALFPNLSVRDNVAYGLVNRGMKRAEIAVRVDELLVLIGLPGMGDKLPGQLSGGQQQRIALARALAPSPGILLLDEPLSALDAKVRIHLRQQIKELQTRLNLTTIMVTHDQEEALTMADRIVVMNHGVIEQIGTPKEIYHRPASRFVADFVGKMNFLPGRLATDGRVAVGDVQLNVENIHTADGASAGTEVTIGFRPEEVCFRNVAVDSANSFAATIGEIEFLGATLRARLLCPALGEHPILVDFSSDDARQVALGSGKALQIMLRPEHIHVFPGGAA